MDSPNQLVCYQYFMIRHVLQRSQKMLRWLYIMTLCGLGQAWVFTDVPEEVMDVLKNVSMARISNEEANTTRSANSMYPGTKWCGPGNTAQNDNDFGWNKETDKCCKNHDYCPDIILPGQKKYDLTNDAYYTRLNCKCDEEFRKCLHEAEDKEDSASKVGLTYFDLLRTKCFRLDYPIRGCKRYSGILHMTCVEYSYYLDRKQVYQWFGVLPYNA